MLTVVQYVLLWTPRRLDVVSFASKETNSYKRARRSLKNTSNMARQRASASRGELRSPQRHLLLTSLALMICFAGSLPVLRETGTCDPSGPRTDCGFSGIDQAGCEGKGCCWSPGTGAWCFFKSGPTPPGPTPPTPPPGPVTPPPSSWPVPPTPPLPGCAVYNEDVCPGSVIVTNDSYASNRHAT